MTASSLPDTAGAGSEAEQPAAEPQAELEQQAELGYN